MNSGKGKGKNLVANADEDRRDEVGNKKTRNKAGSGALVNYGGSSAAASPRASEQRAGNSAGTKPTHTNNIRGSGRRSSLGRPLLVNYGGSSAVASPRASEQRAGSSTGTKPTHTNKNRGSGRGYSVRRRLLVNCGGSSPVTSSRASEQRAGSSAGTKTTHTNEIRGSRRRNSLSRRRQQQQQTQYVPFAAPAASVVSAPPQHASTSGYDSFRDAAPQLPKDESDGDDSVDSDDGYACDASEKSHETRKNNSRFKAFFEILDKLTLAELNEQAREWHCQACDKGPGAMVWYKGLQPLITHAKTTLTNSKRHREFAALVEEELRIRGISVLDSGESFDKWKGLDDTKTDRKIVWPPMVVITNTWLDKDCEDKWTGMGNKQLLDYFSSYSALKARQSYGPDGHRGMGVLIFEPSATGYMEAERLHRDFREQGVGQHAWITHQNPFAPDGKRQLYGYLARKKDIDVFNVRSQDKPLKYDMRSYHEMVVRPMKQMNEANQKLGYLQNKVEKLEEAFEVISRKYQEITEDNMIVRLHTKRLLEENKEEMDFQEKFFMENIDKLLKIIEEKEKAFEKLPQEESDNTSQSDFSSETNQNRRLRKEEIAHFISRQEKGAEELEEEIKKLIRAHEIRKVELKLKYLAEEEEMEKELDASLNKVMEKHALDTFLSST